MTKPGSFLGRGLEPTAGKPFGYAHNMERREIRAHLIGRGLDPRSLDFEFRVTRIQERLHKYAPTLRDRQAAWRARQPAFVAPVIFTAEELAKIAERFSGANDDLGREIWRKAQIPEDDPMTTR